MNWATVVENLAERWSLEIGERFPVTPGQSLPGNFVAPVTRADGSHAVLKVSSYRRETRTEIEALRLWNGIGAARLLDADPDLGALLMERIEPGTMLAKIQDDDETVRVAAGLLRELWCPLPKKHKLRSLKNWTAAYDRNREAICKVDGFPRQLFGRADALRSELLATTEDSRALHGDLHHFNILRSTRAGWLAIDPKGLAGDRGFDVCQFLKNPGPVATAVSRRRLDIFSDELGLARERLSQWALVHAVLDACWDYEDGNSWLSAIDWAEQTLSF